MLKITIIICQKSQKGLDNNGKFELNISQFYVFQEKKNQNHTLKIQNHHLNKSKIPV